MEIFVLSNESLEHCLAKILDYVRVLREDRGWQLFVVASHDQFARVHERELSCQFESLGGLIHNAVVEILLVFLVFDFGFDEFDESVVKWSSQRAEKHISLFEYALSVSIFHEVYLVL